LSLEIEGRLPIELRPCGEDIGPEATEQT